MNVNKLIKEFLKDQKGYIVTYVLFMFAYPLSSVFLPKYYGQIVDNLKEGVPPKFSVAIVLLVLVNIMFLAMDQLDTVFIPKFQAYVRMNIVKMILENYKDKFQEQESGALISKIVKLPIVVRELVFAIRNHIAPLTFVLLMVMVQFTLIDKRIGAITISGIIAGLCVLTPIAKDVINNSIGLDNEMDVIHENISELFDNLLNIYSMNMVQDEIQNLENDQKEIVNQFKKTVRGSIKFRIIMISFGITLFLSIIVYAYYLYKHKNLEMAKMVNVIVTGMFIIGNIGGFAGEIPDIVLNLGSYIRIQRYLDKLDLQPVKTESFTISNGKINFHDVSIKYGDKLVLQNFNLVVRPGESIAIVGRIGSGKSSLVKALLKLIPYEGHIYIDGKDIQDLEPATVRSQILFVQQNPIPFNRSLYENIVYGNSNTSRENVIDIFNKYDLHSFFNHKLDDPVGKKGGKLSGGQKMVLFLLRIMIQNDKKVVILDEPTSSLDNVTAQKITDIIKDVTKKQTTIIITHDNKLHDIVDRVMKII